MKSVTSELKMGLLDINQQPINENPSLINRNPMLIF